MIAILDPVLLMFLLFKIGSSLEEYSHVSGGALTVCVKTLPFPDSLLFQTSQSAGSLLTFLALNKYSTPQLATGMFPSEPPTGTAILPLCGVSFAKGIGSLGQHNACHRGTW